MVIKHIIDCPQFIAGDSTHLRELLHPVNDNLNIRFSIAHAVVPAGGTSVKHKLRSIEVYYIIQGEGEMHIDDETAKVGPGDTVFIPPDAVQYISNTGSNDLQFLCVVDPYWRLEDETIV